ncbi:zinc ribbon domain-containing protein [Methylobacterium sp. WL30]|nr:zinc ribbon domain-containing protein [Methylobacterium sp. WL93]TXN50113.1 zinc ribbon domain-containing protein [Methylobacterium sp. WL119]TXN65926.1 zinc ribbon domain-containing protein [Methylobacterium sp. WL30]
MSCRWVRHRTPISTSTLATTAGPRWSSSRPRDPPGRAGSGSPGLSAVSPDGLEREDAMPIYEYACEMCGPFTAMRPMAQFLDACPCPECGTGTTRAFLSAPAIASSSSGGRVPYAATEPGAASPRRASAAHPVGCGCCVRRMPMPAALSTGGRVFTAHGSIRRSR